MVSAVCQGNDDICTIITRSSGDRRSGFIILTSGYIINYIQQFPSKFFFITRSKHPGMESPHKRVKLEHPSTLPTDDILGPQVQTGLLPEDTVDENVELLPEERQYHRRYQLTGHKKAVSSVKFSPDGKYLASACTLLRE